MFEKEQQVIYKHYIISLPSPLAKKSKIVFYEYNFFVCVAYFHVRLSRFLRREQWNRPHQHENFREEILTIIAFAG